MPHLITSLLLTVLSLAFLNGGNCETDRFGNPRPRPMAPDDPNLVPYHVVGGVSPAGEHCNKMAGDCRLMAMKDASNQETRFEVSCYCYMREDDVTGNLDDLMQRPCPLVPKEGQIVDHAVLNITRCFVERQTVPLELIAALRRSRHLTIIIEGARRLRLPHPQTDMLGAPLETIDVTISDSTLSGIGRGLVSGAHRLRLAAHTANLGVINSGAFAHYDDPHADVHITFNHTNVTKFAMDSVQLPLTGSLDLSNSRIEAVDGGAISGAGEIAFRDSTIAVILRGAINIAHLTKLELINCTIASVEDKAVISLSDVTETDTIVGNDSLGHDSADRHGYAVPEFSSDCHVIVDACEIMGIASAAFTEICKASQVTWKSNLILDTFDGPLLLESPDCPLPPSSILSSSMLKCTNCSVFNEITIEMCPVYFLATCSICPGDRCPKTINDFISDDCPVSDSILQRLNDTCHGKKSSRRLHFSSTAPGPNAPFLGTHWVMLMLLSFMILVVP